MHVPNVSRLLRTMRHLRSSQVLWRARYALERRLPIAWTAPPADRDPEDAFAQNNIPRLRPSFPGVPLFHRAGPVGAKAVEALTRGDFEHLHRTVRLSRRDPDWREAGVEAGRLWTVTLHYHGWIYDLAEAAGNGHSEAWPLLKDYWRHWLSEAPLRKLGSGHLAWNSFAIATRIGWWIRALQVLKAEHWADDPDLLRKILRSLVRQADHLEHHLEWDLRGNHLLRDAVGLAWAGRFFGGRQGDRWLEAATELAVEQAREQVLADGGHFERSPMYHIHVMEDFVSLACLLVDSDAVRMIHDACGSMADYLRWVLAPDGQFPLFNDAAWHAVCEPEAMLEIVRRMGEPFPVLPPRGLRHLTSTGIVAWQGNPWTVCWDVGPVGPQYQPGHAHADTLTLDAWCGGRSLLVDPGTFSYDRDDRRRYDRATSSHNTVCIDDTDSSEVWDIFRVGQRAQPRNVMAQTTDTGFTGSAGHDGYDLLPGQPQHSRSVTVDGRALQIVDTVTGRQLHSLAGGWLLHPDWTWAPTADGWRLEAAGSAVEVTITSETPLDLRVEQRPWHPEYGLEVKTNRLTWQCRAELPVRVMTRFVVG
ncbi:MAG TPA: alginate lyase family protein [Planctomycetaceae bacterium]|nr:alginate lyase family protein [Planctomycetaceae bacterium]